jgi:Raf kinase inhibitor-like YbhB/YbcL family protein
MKRMPGVAALGLATALMAGAASAQQSQTLLGATARQLTVATIEPKDHAALKVTSTSFTAGGEIPKANSAYGANKSPQLSWTGAPKGVATFLVILEDPDVGVEKPFTHWIIGNLPPTTTSLPEGLTASPPGAFQTGVRGNSYFGPRPPSGVHHYTFQVFALDAKLNLKDGAKLPEVQGAMTEHVLASGALQGTYAGPAKPQ